MPLLYLYVYKTRDGRRAARRPLHKMRDVTRVKGQQGKLAKQHEPSPREARPACAARRVRVKALPLPGGGPLASFSLFGTDAVARSMM